MHQGARDMGDDDGGQDRGRPRSGTVWAAALLNSAVSFVRYLLTAHVPPLEPVDVAGLCFWHIFGRLPEAPPPPGARPSHEVAALFLHSILPALVEAAGWIKTPDEISTFAALRRTAVEAFWWRQAVDRWTKRLSGVSPGVPLTRCTCASCAAAAGWHPRVQRIATIEREHAPSGERHGNHPLWRALEGTFVPEVVVALGLNDDPAGATLEDDAVLLASAALGARLPEVRHVEAVTRLAARFPRPVHRMRWPKVSDALQMEAQQHGLTTEAELSERVKIALLLGLPGGAPGERPLPDIGSVRLGDDGAELHSRILRLLNRLVTEDLLGHGSELTDDDAAKRVVLEDEEIGDTTGEADRDLVQHALAAPGAGPAVEPEIRRLEEQERLQVVAREADLSEVEEVALLVMLQGGGPADLAAARNIKANNAQQIFFRTRRKITNRFSRTDFRRLLSM